MRNLLLYYLRVQVYCSFVEFLKFFRPFSKHALWCETRKLLILNDFFQQKSCVKVRLLVKKKLFKLPKNNQMILLRMSIAWALRNSGETEIRACNDLCKFMQIFRFAHLHQPANQRLPNDVIDYGNWVWNECSLISSIKSHASQFLPWKSGISLGWFVSVSKTALHVFLSHSHMSFGSLLKSVSQNRLSYLWADI